MSSDAFEAAPLAPLPSRNQQLSAAARSFVPASATTTTTATTSTAAGNSSTSEASRRNRRRHRSGKNGPSEQQAQPQRQQQQQNQSPREEQPLSARPRNNRGGRGRNDAAAVSSSGSDANNDSSNNNGMSSGDANVGPGAPVISNNNNNNSNNSRNRRGIGSGGRNRNGGVNGDDAAQSHRRPQSNGNATAATTQVASSVRVSRRFQGSLTSSATTTAGSANESQQHQMRADRNAEYLAHVKHLELPDDADLATTISHGLTTATYECMVCCDVIKPFQATWGCDSCWAVFHLRCVQKWARRSIAETSLQSDGNAGSSGTEWTCPSCRAGHDVLPESYKCFCGRSDDPETRKFITPHSCGESCSRPRIQDHCVHSCSLPCHPGPCPPCPAMISTSCHCGRVETKSRCSSYNPTEGMSCGEVCGELLGCGKHYCQDTCHSGLCKPCGEAESKSCECGKVERTVACGTRKLNCDKVCNALYSCGVHECKQSCHNSNDGSHKTCPQSPALISSCPCGKQSIDLLCRIPRISCSDPIPTCGATCDKILICGHKCSKRCHSGDCPPCDKRIDVKCRCGLTSANRKCDEQMARITAGDGSDVVTCQHKCNALRVCGRHECGETCCPSYKPPRRGKAALVASTPDDDGGAHMCLLICGKPLKCGKHNCMALCHRGPCDPCLEASFDEYHCPCGKTIVYPPIRCGTPPPKCPHTCTRTRTCGHVDPHPHECHSDDVACPPCPVLGQRPCMCGKTSVRNVACHRPTPSCGTVCGKPLSCGGHFCKRLCHSGECLDSATTAWGGKGSAVTLGRCNQICGKPRRSCSHPCDETCHVPASCSETAPCAFKVDLSCPCGRLTAKRNCGATATSKPRQQIDCTQACLVAERNKRLAQALSVREDTAAVSTSASVGSQIALYEPELIEFARSYIPWILGIERQFADHLADPIRKALYLQPMDRLRRQMVHMLAAHYNMTSESVDPEPHRSVIVRKQLSPTPSQIPPNLLSKSLFMTVEQQQIMVHGDSSQQQQVNAIILLNTSPLATEDVLSDALNRVFNNRNSSSNNGGSDSLPKTSYAFAIEWYHSQFANDYRIPLQWSPAAAVFITDTASEVAPTEDEITLELLRARPLLKDRLVVSGLVGSVECAYLNERLEVLWPPRLKSAIAAAGAAGASTTSASAATAGVQTTGDIKGGMAFAEHGSSDFASSGSGVSKIPQGMLMANAAAITSKTALTGKPQSSPASAMARVSVAANPFELPISKVDTSELPDNWEEASSDDEDDK